MKKQIKTFLLIQTVFSLAVFITFFQGRLRSYNSTMLALSYRNGFTSRALLGTIYHVIEKILPGDQMNYSFALGFGVFCTLLMIPALLWFSKTVLEKTEESARIPAEILLLILALITMGTYSAGYNFLRVDMFMLLTSLLGITLLIKDKAAFLCIPLSVIGVMFHQGYVFMYFNIILITTVVLFLKAEEKKDKIKYGAYTVLSFVFASIFFLYFEMFSRNSGREVYETVRSEAEKLSYKGIYHTTLLAHETLGVDLDDTEYVLRVLNRLQTPLYIFFMLPFIILFIVFLKKLFKNSKDNKQKLLYIFYAIGAITMAPSYILKCDYGRWILSTVTYYIVSALMLIAIGDKNTVNAVAELDTKVRKAPFAPMILAYIVLFIPFLDVDICETIMHCLGLVDDIFPWLWDLPIWHYR